MVDYKELKTLVVDDTFTMRKLVVKSLKHIGFSNIKEADDGEIAWSMLSEAIHEGEPFDFVVCDCRMPKVSGLDLLRQIRSHPDIMDMPFLMVTAETDKSNVVDIVKAGVDEFVVKPFTREALKAKISKVFSAI